MQRRCPAVLIAAPSSGQGKTTFTVGLARYHRNQGRVVRVFKTGPDFLDPMILEQASGNPVRQLDLWMAGEDACRQMLHDAAADADLILIEGVMGLHDGSPSSADLALTFGVPVMALIDASAMAQTFGALALGLASYRPDVPFAGVVANRVASDGHAEMLANCVPEHIPFYGALRRDEAMTLPERHLGLVQALELVDLEARLDAAATAVERAGITALPPSVALMPAELPALPRTLDGRRIAVACDAAFAFIYPANLDLLRRMGAELLFFSPLTDTTLPAADALWLPGGYPELHLDQLAANTGMQKGIRVHVNDGRPLLAECGGMLYLLETLADREGNEASMAGLLPGTARLEKKLVAIGMQAAPLPEGTIRGHAFHHTRSEIALEPIAVGERARGTRPGEAVYRQGSLTASYIHLYFPSNPEAVAALFGADRA